MPLTITPKEQDRINSAVRSMHMAWPLLVRATTPAMQIAGVRMYLGSQDRKDKTYQHILCKLVELYPEQRDAVIVSSSYPEKLLHTSAMTRMLPTYKISYRDNSGPGSWINRQHDAIMAALIGQYDSALTRGYPFVIIRSDLHDFLTAYYEQEKASALVNKAETVTVRSALTDEMLTSSSSSERRRVMKDSHGSCYTCGAPKPRKVVCAVCGYKPRNT